MYQSHGSYGLKERIVLHHFSRAMSMTIVLGTILVHMLIIQAVLKTGNKKTPGFLGAQRNIKRMFSYRHKKWEDFPFHFK